MTQQVIGADRELTPSSQAKKSCFDVRIGIYVTVGRVLEEKEETGEGEYVGEGAETGGFCCKG